MENKYFTPDIEDIHVGYECEVTPKFKNLWGLTRIDGSYIMSIEKGEWEVRTSYLTKEQIEAEGWVLKTKSINLWFESDIEKASSLQEFYNYKCYKLFLNYGLHDQKLIIKGDFTGSYNFEQSDTLFEGFCPSINEFRTICKLLNIK